MVCFGLWTGDLNSWTHIRSENSKLGHARVVHHISAHVLEPFRRGVFFHISDLIYCKKKETWVSWWMSQVKPIIKVFNVWHKLSPFDNPISIRALWTTSRRCRWRLWPNVRPSLFTRTKASTSGTSGTDRSDNWNIRNRHVRWIRTSGTNKLDG